MFAAITDFFVVVPLKSINYNRDTVDLKVKFAITGFMDL